MGPQPSVSNPRLISTESAREAIYHALQLFVGQGRAWSCADLALALTAAGHDTKAGTVGSWISSDPLDRRTPPSDVLLKLGQVLGPAFTSKVLSAIGQGAHSLAAVSGSPAEIIAALTEGSAQFAVRGVDGVYCNVDRGRLEAVADRMIEYLTPFSTKGC